MFSTDELQATDMSGRHIEMSCQSMLPIMRMYAFVIMLSTTFLGALASEALAVSITDFAWVVDLVSSTSSSMPGNAQARFLPSVSDKSIVIANTAIGAIAQAKAETSSSLSSLAPSIHASTSFDMSLTLHGPVNGGVNMIVGGSLGGLQLASGAGIGFATSTVEANLRLIPPGQNQSIPLFHFQGDVRAFSFGQESAQRSVPIRQRLLPVFTGQRLQLHGDIAASASTEGFGFFRPYEASSNFLDGGGGLLVSLLPIGTITAEVTGPEPPIVIVVASGFALIAWWRHGRRSRMLN